MHAGAELPLTNSGGSWTQRQGLHFRRLCARPGCGTPATATLRFQPTLRQAWLVDLDESAARTQGDLCRRHAAALVLPRGWELHDERTSGPRLVDDKPVRAAAPARRVRVRRRATKRRSDEEPDQLPGFEPVVVPNGNGAVIATEAVEVVVEAEDAPAHDVETAAGSSRPVPAQFGANDGDDADVDDEALSTILDARTPLLQRAFRNAKPDA